MRKLIAKMINDTYKILISDEYLLRLLYFDPNSSKIDPPLLPEDNLIHEQDLNLPPTPEYKKMWEIIERHILKKYKGDNLEESRLCRIYVYTGKARPVIGNRMIAKQEIVIDVFCHSTYEADQRLELIISRLNELLIGQRITGLGKIDLRTAYNLNAPKEYEAYRIIYETGRTKQ